MERYLSKQRVVTEKQIESEPPNKKQKKNTCPTEMQCKPTTSVNSVETDKQITCSNDIVSSLELDDDVPHYAREPSSVEMKEMENINLVAQNENEKFNESHIIIDGSCSITKGPHGKYVKSVDKYCMCFGFNLHYKLVRISILQFDRS